MWSRWLNWFRGAASRRPGCRVLFYTRAGCHLCEDALKLLRQAQRRYGFELAECDVDEDPLLVERHGNCVPVVEVNGRVRFRGRVNPVLLERVLRAECGG
jgi:glutaredoxin